MNAPALPDWLTTVTPTITFSTLPDVSAHDIRQQATTFAELAATVANPPTYPDKFACPLIKLATFGSTRSEKGSLRHDGNIVTVTGIEGDYDDEQVPMTVAVERARSAGIAAVFYTSASHTPEKPRWRVLCPLSVPVPPDQREGLLARVDALLGGILASESYTLSQTFFYGRVTGAPFESVVVDGVPFDAILPPVERVVRQGKGKGPTQTLPLPDDFTEVLARIELGDYTEVWAPTVLGALNTFGEAAIPGLVEWSLPWYRNKKPQWSDDTLRNVAAHDIGKRLQREGIATWENVRERAGLTRHDTRELFKGAPSSGGPSPVEWGEMRPIPKLLLPVQPFDYALLPPVFAEWVRDTAERKCWSPDYLAVAIVVVAGMLIGRKACIAPMGIDDDWREFPNLWGLFVGLPSAAKSPAISTVFSFVSPMVEAAEAAYKIQKKEYDSEKEFHDAEVKALEAKRLSLLKGKDNVLPDKEAARLVHKQIDDLNDQFKLKVPRKKRYYTTDATAEALIEIFYDNPQGVGFLADEFTRLLKQMLTDNFAPLRGTLLSSWNGKTPHTVDRISGDRDGKTSVLCSSVLGGIQPGMLPLLINDDDEDGLAQRFGLMVWPDSTTALEEASRPPAEGLSDSVKSVLHRLNAMDMLDEPRIVPFDSVATKAFNQWRCKMLNDIENGITDLSEGVFVAKYPKLLCALALIFAMCDRNAEVIPMSALERAMRWEPYLRSHLQRVIGYAASRSDVHATNIITKLKRGNLGTKDSKSGLTYTTSRELQRKQYPGCDTSIKARELLDWLTELGYLHLVEKSHIKGAKEVYFVNPGLFEQGAG